MAYAEKSQSKEQVTQALSQIHKKDHHKSDTNKQQVKEALQKVKEKKEPEKKASEQQARKEEPKKEEAPQNPVEVQEQKPNPKSDIETLVETAVRDNPKEKKPELETLLPKYVPAGAQNLQQAGQQQAYQRPGELPQPGSAYQDQKRDEAYQQPHGAALYKHEDKDNKKHDNPANRDILSELLEGYKK